MLLLWPSALVAGCVARERSEDPESPCASQKRERACEPTLDDLRAWCKGSFDVYELHEIAGKKTNRRVGEMEIWTTATRRIPRKCWEGINGEPHDVPASVTTGYCVFTVRVDRFDGHRDGAVYTIESILFNRQQ